MDQIKSKLGKLRTAYEEFFTRKLRIDGVKSSEFDFWFAAKFICPYFGHKWDWWQLIERSKCRRCLAANERDQKAFEVSARFGYLRKENLYRKLQTPFWKIAGYQPTAKDKAQEKWMKRANVDYYDLQRIRDMKEQARYQKNPDDWEKPKKAPKVEYEKRKVNFT